MTDLAGLLARVRGATGANYELECDIADALGMPPKGYRRGFEPPGIIHTENWRPPPYSASIDAALALVERVMPGWGWVLIMPDCIQRKEMPSAQAFEASIYRRGTGTHGSPEEDAEHYAPTMPLAILGALLAALIAKAPPLTPEQVEP